MTAETDFAPAVTVESDRDRFSSSEIRSVGHAEIDAARCAVLCVLVRDERHLVTTTSDVTAEATDIRLVDDTDPALTWALGELEEGARVHPDLLTRDVARFVRSEEEHEVGDVDRFDVRDRHRLEGGERRLHVFTSRVLEIGTEHAVQAVIV